MNPEENTKKAAEKTGGDTHVKKLSLMNITHIVYLCQALSFFLGITSLIGIIINYVKRSAVKGTWLESHFTWQIKTFWIGLVASLIGGCLVFILVGFVILGITLVWVIYRIVKGWLLLSEGKPIENSTAII